MGTIKINNLSFRYFNMTENIFDTLNLNIDESWRLGLIGRNGRGKTTFLNLLLGQYDYHGNIQASVTFNYFPQTVNDPTRPTKTVLLDIAQLSAADFWKIEIETDKLQLKESVFDRPFNTLSPGEQTKALLATMFTNQNAFQLIDEPTNHLDVLGRQTVANYLKAKQGFIVVSHDRNFVDQIVNHILSIDRAKIQLFNGNYSTWEQEFNSENALEEKQNREIKSDIQKLKRTADQTRRWSNNAENKKSRSQHSEQHADLDKGFLGHKASKLMRRRKNALNRLGTEVDNKEKLLKNVEKVAPLTLNYQTPHQKHLLTVNELSVKRDATPLNQPISFDLIRGQRVFLTGANGLGKTTILKAILGQPDLISSGTIDLNQTLTVSYLSQQFNDLKGTIDEYVEHYHVELSAFLNALRKLGFERAIFEHPLETLSMGQKRKISLARALCQPANLYIWDEPLNYLDVITRSQIKDVILAVKPTMLIIDHDQDFIDHVATKRIDLKAN